MKAHCFTIHHQPSIALMMNAILNAILPNACVSMAVDAACPSHVITFKVLAAVTFLACGLVWPGIMTN